MFNKAVNLSNGYILCPVAEVEELQKSNPNVMVIGYDTENVDGLANAFLTTLGYRYEEIGTDSWLSSEANKKHNKYISRTGNTSKPLKSGVHSGSMEDSRDRQIGRLFRRKPKQT